MLANAFCASVLPDAGYLIVATPVPIPNTDQHAWRNVVVETIEQALTQCAEWVWEGKDAYYAMASYRERRVWNPNKKNWRTGKPGAYETRTQANALYLKTLYLDLDIKLDKEYAFRSQVEAVVALREFCTKLQLPKPTLVNSGYGVHVYWPFTEQVSADEWKPVAEKLKARCIEHGLFADHKITADEARVLRLPGTFNFKHGTARAVTLLQEGTAVPLAQLDSALGEPNTPKRKGRSIAPAVAASSGFDNNIGVTNDPINPGMVMFNCAAFAKQVVERGRTASEPQWRTALGIALFCEPQVPVMRAVSDGHPDFDEAAMHAKVANWTKGPSRCAAFWEEDKHTCESCPHWGKITSPAQLGRAIHTAPPPVVTLAAEDGTQQVIEIPNPPEPYARRKLHSDGTKCVVIGTEDSEGRTDWEVVFPYDLYPIRVLRQTGPDSVIAERSLWRVALPKLGEVEVHLPQGLLADVRKLHAFWLDQGAPINPNQAKATQFYMSAYLRELNETVEREKVYERLGWHEDHHSFVTATHSYHRDGTVSTHKASRHIQTLTRNALHPTGTLAAWIDHIRFYSGPRNFHNRTLLYASLAAPIFHMTGHKGLLITASGDTGRGKTTALEACASMWGEPEPLLVGGGQDGATTNAFYTLIGTYHSYPVFWDDTTERDSVEIRRFLLNFPSGKGKIRNKGSDHDGKSMTWETIIISSTNTDDIMRLMATGKDTDPHLMRMMGIEFLAADTSTEMKLRADRFKRGIRENYGHVGPALMQYITPRYETVKQRVEFVMQEIDRRVQAESPERFRTAAIAAMYVAARIAFKRGLIPFNPDDDFDQLCGYVATMRVRHQTAVSTPADTLGEFLETHVPNTLILASKSASNIDNIVHHPRGALHIRQEVDSQKLFVARTAVMAYCVEANANFNKLQDALMKEGILVRHNCHKVLGAETPYAKGQTRCWEIDIAALEAAKH